MGDKNDEGATTVIAPDATHGEHVNGSDPSSRKADQKQVLVPIADGSCETETIGLSTTLRKFGAIVVLASVGGEGGSKICSMEGGFTMTADITIEEAMEYDWDLIVLPGGEKGACIMQCSDVLLDLLQRQKELQKLYAASGAAPARVLAYEGEQLSSPISTCYPIERLRDKLPKPTDADVVIWNNVITSQGVGIILLFAIELGQLLFETKYDEESKDGEDGAEDVGYEKAKSISRRLLIDRTGKLGFRRLVHRDNKSELRYDQPLSLSPADENVGTLNIDTPMPSSDETLNSSNSDTSVKHISKTTNPMSLLRKATECIRRFEYTPRQHDRERRVDDKEDTNMENLDEVPALAQDTTRKSRKRANTSLAKETDALEKLSTAPKNGDPLSTVDKTKVAKTKHRFSPVKAKKSNNSTWDVRFQEICEYHKLHGDCNIPSKSPSLRKLKNWVNNTRYNKRRLSQEQIQKLDSIGFFSRTKEKPNATQIGHKGILQVKCETKSVKAAGRSRNAKKPQPALLEQSEDQHGLEAQVGQDQGTLNRFDSTTGRVLCMKTVVTSPQKNVTAKIKKVNGRKVSSKKRSAPVTQVVPDIPVSSEASSIDTRQTNLTTTDRRRRRRSNHAEPDESSHLKPKNELRNEQPLTDVSERPRKKKRRSSNGKTDRKAAAKSQLLEFLERELDWTFKTVVYESKSTYYYFPPGVSKENGKVRKDYFDSIGQALKHLKSSTEWKESSQLRELVANYECPGGDVENSRVVKSSLAKKNSKVESRVQEEEDVLEAQLSAPQLERLLDQVQLPLLDQPESRLPKKDRKVESCVLEVEENRTGNALNHAEGGWGEWGDIRGDETATFEPEAEENCYSDQNTKVYALEAKL